jgi:hypothetical protein
MKIANGVKVANAVAGWRSGWRWVRRSASVSNYYPESSYVVASGAGFFPGPSG